VGDQTNIQSGDIVLDDKFDYTQLVSKAKLVAGGVRMYKTSKSDNEGGIIKVGYSQRGQMVDNSTI